MKKVDMLIMKITKCLPRKEPDLSGLSEEDLLEIIRLSKDPGEEAWEKIVEIYAKANITLEDIRAWVEEDS